MLLVCSCWKPSQSLPGLWRTMQPLGILMLLTMTDCGFGASLDVALGVHWSSYENQGRLGSYLSKDFASHVLLPLLTRVADAILDERAVNYYQNVVLIAISIIVLGVITFGSTWLYARRHFLQKMNILIATQPNLPNQPNQPIQPRFANDV